jgi:hypothetical protein
MSYVEHARRELRLAGITERDPAYAAGIVAAVAVLQALVAGEQRTADTAREQLGVLLAYGTLTPLTDDPHEWLDRSGPTGRALWQNARNPYAYSNDGGRTYWLLAERQAHSPAAPPTYPSAPRPLTNDDRWQADVVSIRRPTRKDA